MLHLKQNPMSMAVEKRALEVDTLREENEALRTRIRLIEEGQTKDITMMVGQRWELIVFYAIRLLFKVMNFWGVYDKRRAQDFE